MRPKYWLADDELSWLASQDAQIVANQHAFRVVLDKLRTAETLNQKSIAVAMFRALRNSYEGERIESPRIRLASGMLDARRSRRLKALERVRDEYPWIRSLAPDYAVPAQRTMLHVGRVVKLVSLLVPKRIADEEVGDSLEVFAEHFRRSGSRWQAYLKLVSMVFWITVNTTRHVVAAFKGQSVKRTSGEGPGT